MYVGSDTAGPPDELARFCEEIHPRLVGFLGLYTGSADAGQDLAQDTLERVCANWRSLVSHPSRENWAFRVGINLATTRRRWWGRREQFAWGSDAARPSGHDVVQALDLQRQLATLPTRERSALICRFYLDLSVVDTATVLACPPNTVKTLTRSALARLRVTPPTEQVTHEN